jgi:hypothetical protein
VTSEFERMWKEVAVAQLKGPFLNLSGDTEENQEKSLSE